MISIYALRDSKAGFFLPILEASGDEHAQRIVADAIAGGAKNLAAHPNDYCLYWLADYDNQTGELEPGVPKPVKEVAEIIQQYFKQPEQTQIEEMAGEAKTQEDS